MTNYTMDELCHTYKELAAIKFVLPTKPKLRFGSNSIRFCRNVKHKEHKLHIYLIRLFKSILYSYN